ncbi:hypothetical protein Vadar_018788 [Vaccinium darrowii]|uniref:Uncharacterized protein n=1 Tax=Vaccinium darrowii TaxID=229202 RepID=A0ACB7Z685_9ERIC|nr:hypothetical protein Vadar_018788 [Vaccinium darrowii]
MGNEWETWETSTVIRRSAYEIRSLLDNLAEKNPKVEAFLRDKNMETNRKKAHMTLAHKRSHGVKAVANYGVFLDREISVEIPALLFSDKMAALETAFGSVDAKDANLLPQLHSEGKAIRIDIDPPITVTGILQFY